MDDKKEEQEKIRLCIFGLMKYIEANEFEYTVTASSLISLLVTGVLEKGLSKKSFIAKLGDAYDHYKNIRKDDGDGE